MQNINNVRSDTLLDSEGPGPVSNIALDELRYDTVVRDVVWMDVQRNPGRSWFVTRFTVPFRSIANMGTIDIPNAVVHPVHVLPLYKDRVRPKQGTVELL